MLAVWEGGLSFHGGITGAAIAIYIFSKKRGYNFLSLADLLCIPATLALAFGRIANFINGELYGRPTNLPWGVKFKGAEEFRHPSQLYESLKNFLILLILYTKDKKSHKPGHIFSLFLILYSVLRFSVEFVRVPELYVGPLTMGQTLSIPLFIIGIILYKKTKN
jgi:phosphatidylglycerol:prolipoprotein diacylglycerol transferase